MAQLTIELSTRERNRWLVLFLMGLLACISLVIPARLVVRIGNRILSLYRIDIRTGSGPWQRFHHGLTMALGR